jgi:protein-S-isoprenylcysteine O-methyltransferase Ste14
MRAVDAGVALAWIAFWVYWLLAAAGAKRGAGPRRRRPPGLAIAAVVIALAAVTRPGRLVVHEPVVQAIGAAVVAAGLGLAVWARIALGRNWGMPMTTKDEPELVTSGPYRFVRHPIYTGILVAMLGSALATSLYWLVALVIVGTYFVHSARVEERLMTGSFPAAYPSYQARTKMLIPFVL